MGRGRKKKKEDILPQDQGDRSLSMSEYIKLIHEDLAVIEEHLPKGFHKEHIKCVIKYTVKFLYPEFDGTMFHKTNLERVRK